MLLSKLKFLKLQTPKYNYQPCYLPFLTIITANSKLHNPKIEIQKAIRREKFLESPTVSGTKNAANENKIIAWLIFEKAEDKSFH